MQETITMLFATDSLFPIFLGLGLIALAVLWGLTSIAAAIRER